MGYFYEAAAPHEEALLLKYDPLTC